MKFCPKCGSRLKNKHEESGVVLACIRCDYREEGSIKKSEVIKGNEDALKIISEESEIDMMPTIKIECPKCKHDTAVWWMLQTRSADEPTTQFYRCTKCNYTWRHYA
ncbi:MAG: transcription factor S [Candidatus Nitrosocaldaceae archaeon]